VICKTKPKSKESENLLSSSEKKRLFSYQILLVKILCSLCKKSMRVLNGGYWLLYIPYLNIGVSFLVTPVLPYMLPKKRDLLTFQFVCT
jgi:hypothetical protein